MLNVSKRISLIATIASLYLLIAFLKLCVPARNIRSHSWACCHLLGEQSVIFGAIVLAGRDDARVLSEIIQCMEKTLAQRVGSLLSHTADLQD